MKLHACICCQHAKTACDDVRPCHRCVRLKLECDGDTRTVKRACTNCKSSKVKCDMDAFTPCRRCARLCLECTPYLPNKRKKNVGGDNEDQQYLCTNVDPLLEEIEHLSDIGQWNDIMMFEDNELTNESSERGVTGGSVSLLPMPRRMDGRPRADSAPTSWQTGLDGRPRADSTPTSWQTGFIFPGFGRNTGDTFRFPGKPTSRNVFPPSHSH